MERSAVGLQFVAVAEANGEGFARAMVVVFCQSDVVTGAVLEVTRIGEVVVGLEMGIVVCAVVSTAGKVAAADDAERHGQAISNCRVFETGFEY